MARTGRPSKPIEEKRRLGNPGKRRLPAKSSLAVVPALVLSPAESPPDQVLDLVLERARTWLGESDLVAVALLRETLEERAVVRAMVLDGVGDARKALRELDKQLVLQLSALGFDPAARARLGVAEVRKQSELEKLLTARTSRRPRSAAGPEALDA